MNPTQETDKREPSNADGHTHAFTDHGERYYSPCPACSSRDRTIIRPRNETASITCDECGTNLLATAEPSESAGAVVLPELDVTPNERNRAFGDTDGEQDGHLFVMSRRPEYVGPEDILSELYCRERQLLASLTREKELQRKLDYEVVAGNQREVGYATMIEVWEKMHNSAVAERDALRAERDSQCKVTPETPDPTWVPFPWEPPAKEEWVPKAEGLAAGTGTRADWCLVAYSLSVKMEEASGELTALRAEVAALRGEGWISVTERLPEPHSNSLVWIPAKTTLGGYPDLAYFGEWFCQDQDCRPGDPAYVEDNDEGNRRGYGWHREEETHGGEYDYVTVDLNAKVKYWRSLPAPPAEVKP